MARLDCCLELVSSLEDNVLARWVLVVGGNLEGARQKHGKKVEAVVGEMSTGCIDL